MPDATNGILIAVDGIDGAGKTTQVQLLVDALRAASEKVVASKEPTDGVWGRKLRQSAQNGRMDLQDELHAFIEDRKEHVASTIRPGLQNGAIVVLDRYFYSTVAYQGARGADVATLVEQMDTIAPRPDIAFLIDIEPNLALDRIRQSRGDIPNEFERAESLEKVRRIFLAMAQGDDAIRIIDGRQSIDAVYATIAGLLVDGPLKAKRCAKPYDCDDIFYCTPALLGECGWFKTQRHLSSADIRERLPALVK